MSRVSFIRYLSFIAAAIALGSTSVVFAGTLLIENVTLIDGTGRPPVTGASVLLDNDRILLVSRGFLTAPKDTQRIDGSGKYLIPGLMDLHVHVPGKANLAFGIFSANDSRSNGIRSLQSYLYSGVTSIYDAGNDPDYILGLREEERNGKITSPRIDDGSDGTESACGT